MKTKQAGQKIREIAKHALQVSANDTTRKVLVKFTEEFVVFVREVLDIGFQSIGKQQLVTKLQLAIDNTSIYSKSLVISNNFDYWVDEVKCVIQKYKKQIISIFSDKVNNKNNRFLIKSLDLAHTIVKDFILYSSSLEILKGDRYYG